VRKIRIFTYNILRKLKDEYSVINDTLIAVMNFFGRNKVKIQGKRNQIISRGGVWRKRCVINITGNHNIIKLEKGVRLEHVTINIYGNHNRIYLSERVLMKDGEFYIEDDGNSIVIGKDTALCGKVQLSCIEGTGIKIGNDCLFSSEIIFRTGDSHSVVDMEGNRLNQSKDIILEDHVWVGSRVTVLKGVKISANSVIAAGSVVTRKFENINVAIGGNPAKIIKREINWTRERI